MAHVEIFQPVASSSRRLWHYLSSATGLSCWQADEVTGDLQGGNFSLRWPTLGVRMDLSVAELDLGRRILLRAGQNALTLTVEDDGVRLKHEGLEESDDLDGLHCSWRIALCILAHAAEKHPEVPRRVSWRFQPVPSGPELAHYYFSQPRGLATWLGTVDRELHQGSEYALRRREGTLSGRVLLSEEGRDLVLGVREFGDAVLVLRTFPGPGGGRVAATAVSCWGREVPAELMGELTTALKRLEHEVTERGTS